ncbi:MAG: adhesin, partial [Candidatus Hydrothermarchaeota archaeon]
MVLDEPNDDDEILKVDNITYIINRDLFNSVKPIEVDWKQSI